MMGSNKRLGYLVAVLGSTLVLLLRTGLSGPLAEQARLLPFVLAVMASAWWGGFGPGLVATLLSLFYCVMFVLPPPFSLTIDTVADGIAAGMFLVIGVTMSFVFESWHGARRRETEKQFRTLADSMPQLVWMARADGRPYWFNRRWDDYLGMRPTEGKAFPAPTVGDPEEIRRVAASWQAAVAAGEAWEAMYPMRRNDGRVRWHLSRAVPVRDDRGGVVCWFGTNTDIQDRIEIEQALKDADARKDEFLAILAHELRNPLAPISNAVQLWPHVANDRAEMEHLRGVIERQVEQLVRLIDDLMDVSRITRGKVVLRREPLSVDSLVSGAVEAVQPLIDAAHHRLTVTKSSEPIYVDGDGARLMQVLCNILNNAAKYTVRNGEISVVVERQDGNAVVRIRDNGPGIPPHMLSRIFERFHQSDRTLDRACGGLGIGLWLSRQFVELHGGTLEAKSEGASKGSEFVVTLPAIAPPPAGLEAAPPAHAGRPGETTGTRRILVVDDLRESGETLAMVLRSLGQDATSLNDGEAAIDWVLANRPDAVLLDIAMPMLDGYEVARRLRQHAELSDVMLVALTGYGQPGDRQRAFEAGFNVHLTKPVTTRNLRELLVKIPIRKRSPDSPLCQT